ncbi:exo-alpha-sialidase [Thalassoroseus pseudoceratinae]|uniref:exo-alpha-sialidase n=1 Tax=Thalassoroseus pseudoceratinae TaxID=2713176 RepID=UPI0014222D9B|nr:exo-alpha-sialidase [Thalassoroseus pseudoceratinae]
MRYRLLLTAMFVTVSAHAYGEDADRIVLSDQVRERCLKVLRVGMRGEEFWPSIHAAEGLTLAGHGAEVIEFLTPKLATDKDDQHRCGIARELVRAGDRAKADIMLKILSSDDPHGHVHAAESLYKVVEIGDGKALRKAFEQDQNIPQKLMAAGALGRCGNPQAMSYLRESLNHDDPNVLRIAVWILGRIGDSSDVPLLKKQLPRCQEDLLKAYVNHSLATLGDDEGLAALAANLKDEDGAVRTYAATFAGDARALSLADSLVDLLDDEHPDAAYRAAQSLLMLAGPPPQEVTEDISQIVYRATPKNPRYTEGSIVALGNGDLLFAVTEFQDGGSDFAKAHIVARRSSDGGRTWGEKKVLQENTGGMNVMSVTLRRLPDGSIGLFYLQKNSHDDLKMFVRHSTDEAETFRDPIPVTTDDGYHVINNDRITVLSSGRLLAPAASTPDVQKVNHFVCRCYLSDDNGHTWRKGTGEVDAPKRGAMEPEVAELKDGRLLMLVRNQLGFVGKSYSEDGGETWSKMTSLGVQGPEAPATLRRIPSTGDLLLIWNNTYTKNAGHGGRRTPLTAAISRDEGNSWTIVNNLEANPQRTYSYTSLTFVGHRAVMSYWESGPGKGQYSCRFRSLPVAWFYSK